MAAADATPQPRVIAHLDMDAFFASVELLRYPQLRGQAVVVGGRNIPSPQKKADDRYHYTRLREYVGRGVITTATYEARALGVHSAMGLMKAASLAPEAILLPANFEAYRQYSKAFKAAVAGIAPHIEDRGIDEIYIDLSEHPQVCHGPAELAFVRAGELARQLQTAVQQATGLSCSIGVTPNKLLSKIASDLHKPGGITVLTLNDLPSCIWPLPARRINGIGPKNTLRLQQLGIETIGQLAAADPAWLSQHFGQRYGQWLHQSAHGLDNRPVSLERERKSVSRETTFQRDLHVVHDKAELGHSFTRLCQRVAHDLQQLGVEGRTVGVKLRYDDFHTVTRDVTLPEPTADAQTIRRAAGWCLKRIQLDRRLRLLGVRVANLSPQGSSLALDLQAPNDTLPLFPEIS